ncbi:HIG1 domain family member 1C-like [Patiria miniata]|uniref:HIG1 domain-containing protein n=1 Tax=Patiria miniata TaxID=46514 RepID=A0A913Z2S7_PATMI|nr:HIG1 domain family member 1C-like [Patiria miniata]
MAGAPSSTVTQTPNIDYGQYKETAVEKLKRKAYDEPFVPLGITAFVGALVWGAVSYKHRKGMSTSIYLMRLRVVAQTCVVGAMTVGAAVTMFKNTMKKD